jgi:hypothetical protein
VCEEFVVVPGRLPEAFIEEAYRTIRPHVTALAIDSTENGELLPIGSGTFIQWDNNFGILTADHVVKISGPRRLNTASPVQRLQIVLDDRPSSFGVESRYLEIISLGDQHWPGEGPDLAVIKLPTSSQLGTIQAKKSFWNLTNHREDKLARACDSRGCMAIAGHPGEDMHDEIPRNGFDQLIISEGLIGITQRDRYFEIRDIEVSARPVTTYDYLEVLSIRDEQNRAPRSYEGVSGGSLWQIPIVRRADEDNSKIRPGQITLAGVPFYQFRVGPEGHNRVRGHGPQSIYGRLVDALREASH